MRMFVAKVQVARAERKLLRMEQRAIRAIWPRWKRGAWVVHRTIVALGEMTWVFLAMTAFSWMAWAQLGTGL